MLWEKPSTKPNGPRKKAVAYYRHSAQDRQENSVEIQQDQVRKFAGEHNIDIIKEFADCGKSGLSVEGRDSFNEMLHVDVEQGAAAFEYVLVLDVSRWGRFQETDLSAYYTGLCLQHGKQVVFTTIGFPKENDLLHGLHLSIERYRAASYSRELSGKVWKGCAKIASGGYWAGGSAPYGMCRMLLDEKRNPVQMLEPGEHKAIHNQRVTLALGDADEVEAVRTIFAAFDERGLAPVAIAAVLNGMGRPGPGGGAWGASAVSATLRNEIYAGVMVWNKSSQKMKAPSRANPTVDWVRSEDAFEAIVPKDVFERAQAKLRQEEETRRRKYSEPGMVEMLTALNAQYGTITGRLVNADATMASAATYTQRFYSLDRAYQALFRTIIDERRAAVIQLIRNESHQLDCYDGFVVVDDLFSVAIQPTVPLSRGYEASWVFHPDQRREVDLTIGVPLSCPQQCEVLGYLAFPRVLCGQKVSIHSASTDSATLYARSLVALINELRGKKGPA